MSTIPDGEERGGYGREGDASGFSRRFEGFVPDMVRKAAFSAVRSFLQTEEGVRSVVGAVVPKDLFSTMGEHLDKSKSELIRLFSGEFRQFLDQIDLHQELQRLLTSVSFEIKTEVRFIPNDEAVLKPQVKSRTKVKQSNKKTPRKRSSGAKSGGGARKSKTGSAKRSTPKPSAAKASHVTPPKTEAD